MRGVLITVEGVEGSGKSTQCSRLAHYLSGRWSEVAQTSEPDGTALGMRRIRGRALDAFEKMDLSFHQRVREGYLEIARADKRRVVVLDAAQDADALHAEVVRVVDEYLARRGGEGGA
jgi:thymidylate kinase